MWTSWSCEVFHAWRDVNKVPKSHEILMFVCLQCTTKQCCHITKLDCTHYSAYRSSVCTTVHGPEWWTQLNFVMPYSNDWRLLGINIKISWGVGGLPYCMKKKTKWSKERKEVHNWIPIDPCSLDVTAALFLKCTGRVCNPHNYVKSLLIQMAISRLCQEKKRESSFVLSPIQTVLSF